MGLGQRYFDTENYLCPYGIEGTYKLYKLYKLDKEHATYSMGSNFIPAHVLCGDLERFGTELTNFHEIKSH